MLRAKCNSQPFNKGTLPLLVLIKTKLLRLSTQTFISLEPSVFRPPFPIPSLSPLYPMLSELTTIFLRFLEDKRRMIPDDCCCCCCWCWCLCCRSSAVRTFELSSCFSWSVITMFSTTAWAILCKSNLCRSRRTVPSTTKSFNELAVEQINKKSHSKGGETVLAYNDPATFKIDWTSKFESQRIGS